MSTKVNVTTTATKPTVYVAQDGDVIVEAIQNGDVVVDVAYNPVGTTSGDVYGPTSSTDNAIARFDGVTGKVIQNSGITIADGTSGTLSGTNTGDQNLFGTIAVSGQSDIVADSTNDTLTFVAGSNITITTDASTDAITISATGGGGGSGDVVGPTSATNYAIARFDSTTGKLIQNSGITIADGESGILSGTNSGDVTLDGSLDYLTISNQQITLGQIDLASDVTGNLPLSNMANLSSGVLLGSDSTGNPNNPVIEIGVGGGLILSGGVLYAPSPSPSGDVFGPASSTDNALVRFDGTTGKLIQDSGITISDGASGTLAGSNSGDVTLSGTPDYITISGQTITRGLIDLTTDVTGDLPLSNLAQSSAASKLLGRGSASGAGDFEEITLGSGLSMSGTTLSASGGSSNVDVKLYTANDTWTNPSPSTAKRVFVKLVGGGAGGGSGRKGAAGSNRYGGSGGAPGATVETWFLTTDLASTVSVTVAAGGTGGAAVTTDSTNGNNGTAGGSTTFSTVTAVGGLAGVGGTAASANQPGGKSSSCLFGLTSAASLGAGSGSNSTGSSVAESIASFPTGGGGGGGLNTSNTTASGGTGGGLGEGTYMQLVAGGTAGTAGNAGGNGNSARGVGTGGGGGGSSASANAGDGGNGGGYGSGGGGGGAATDSVGNSGRGGDGAGGYALIITYT